MKGQIPVIEMITVVVILFVTFAIFFPESNIENRWDDANVILKSRDLMLTIDRIGITNDIAGNSSLLLSFLGDTVPDRNFIITSSLKGSIQEEIIVACNCTVDERETLLNEISRLKLNERNIRVDFIDSTLSPIQKSDVLFIWGYRDLTPYTTEIVDYLKDGNGVIMLSNSDTPNAAFTEIFGLTNCDAVLDSGCTSSGFNAEYDILNQSSSSDPTFQNHKFFYHLPIRSVTTSLLTSDLPEENGIPDCSLWPIPEGTFEFKLTSYRWWACFERNEIYVDTDNNGIADQNLDELDTFTSNGANFVMSYAEMNTTYGRTFVSIKPEFRFDSFGPNVPRLYPSDSDGSKILIDGGTYPGPATMPVLAVNTSTAGLAVWLPEEVTDVPFDHDERLLVASSIFAATNKENDSFLTASTSIGFVTPFINVMNRDVFEVYQFNLGLAFPF